MDMLQTILTRRSIRKYTAEPISDHDITCLVQAGMAAPSATNRRPIHIFVIQKKETLLAFVKGNPYAKMLETAPLCLAIVADKTLQPVKDFQINDGSAAIENILLCAHGLGLGAVWLGVIHFQPWYNVIIERLKLSENMVPIGLISLGHPGETKNAEDRFDLSKIHYD